MWKILAPLIVLVVVILFQIGHTENFATSSSSTDASGNSTDASGNVSSSSSSTITLSLSDLLSLFKYSTPTTSTTTTTEEKPTTITSQTPQDFYTGIRSDLLSDVKGVVRSELVGSPYSPATGSSCSDAPCSDSAAQGLEYQNAMQDFIKKDEIPCYGCTL